MDGHKSSTQIERLEVVETGRRRRWSVDEKLRIVLESLETPRAISSTARRHGISRLLLMTWRRSLRPEPAGPDVQQTGFVRAMVAAADTVAAEASAPAEHPRAFEARGKIQRWLSTCAPTSAAITRKTNLTTEPKPPELSGGSSTTSERLSRSPAPTAAFNIPIG
jgi:transposase